MLIDNKRLESEIKKINIQDFSAIFSRWDNDIRNERKIQTDFLNDIFYDILGYEKNTDRPEYNLDKEQMTDKNKKPVDGVLGFFTNQEKQIKVIVGITLHIIRSNNIHRCCLKYSFCSITPSLLFFQSRNCLAYACVIVCCETMFAF